MLKGIILVPLLHVFCIGFQHQVYEIHTITLVSQYQVFTFILSTESDLNMDKKGKILIVDDNQSVLSSLQLLLSDRFEHVECLKNPELISRTIEKQDFDVVLLDMNFSAGVNTGNEGLFWLKNILDHDKTLSVVLLTAYGSIDLAIKAVKLGAVDFVVKPWDNKKLLATLNSALRLRTSAVELRELKQKQKQINRTHIRKTKIFRSNSIVMQELYGQFEKIIHTDVNVLILGESGTGKEILAQEIHSQSHRRDEAFIGVDLGAVSETVFESELFGHMRGAFTDAKDDRMGRVQVASGGTLFLDEIGNVPLSLQVKLLTLLQNRTVTPIGADHPVAVDIRLVCATNMDLESMIQEGTFREDLFYRINTIQLTIPSLRERSEDIPDFAYFFLQHYQDKYLKENLGFIKDALDKMRAYSWPGNVRELKHAIERAVILSDSKTLKAEDILMKEKRPVTAVTQKPTLEFAEKEIIRTALQNHVGNISHAAKELDITRQTLYAKIHKYGL